jgi:hypothetical protein
MRRKFVDSWEVQARDRAESLRQNFDGLLYLGRAFDIGSVDHASFFESFNASISSTREVVHWLPEWRDQAIGRVSPQAEPAFAVFSKCLPLLAGSAELLARPMALLVLAPDGNGEEDRVLAGTGGDISQEASVLALAMIHDTPALRRKHGRMVSGTLQAVSNHSEQVAAALPLVRDRLHHLAASQGLEIGPV